MPLEIIGAGQGRTGTVSLKLALEQLGFGPCYHMSELAIHPNQWPVWERVWEDKPVDWEDIFHGYRSAVDAPTCFVYRELAERYPNAKVILTVRDPQSWYKSVASTVGSAETTEVLATIPFGAFIGKFAAYVGKQWGTAPGAPPAPEEAMAAFVRHNEAVKRAIPPERLLIFEVKQGWAPLCKFLNVPTPDGPFPHENSTADHRQRINQAVAEMSRSKQT